MLLVLGVSAPLRQPASSLSCSATRALVAPILGAIAFPLAQTLIGSADGTAPFFGRLRAAYRDARAWARGVVVGAGCWWAYAADVAHMWPSVRFCLAFVVGAVAYAGVDALFDAGRILAGERRRMQKARVYGLGVLLGGFVAGSLGWYFDAAQIGVVWAKFWAYADVDYRAAGRALGDFVTYPIFNKYGMINLGEVAGGVRLLYAESLSGVINWSFAAPLFAINAVFLTAMLDRSLTPIRGLLTGAGAQGLVELTVRVMRWGLWMAPIINTFLRQSADPSWYNQDGAVRSLVAIGADVGMPHDRFADFSLTMFLGLLAYDWLRVLIWFDHMGLRVATLVNLTFIGGDRARRGGGAIPRPRRAHPRHSRQHPPLRHLGAAAHSLLHPARRRLGQGVDRRRSAVARRRDARRGQDAGGRLRRRRRRGGRGGAGARLPARAKRRSGARRRWRSPARRPR